MANAFDVQMTVDEAKLACIALRDKAHRLRVTALGLRPGGEMHAAMEGEAAMLDRVAKRIEERAKD